MSQFRLKSRILSFLWPQVLYRGSSDFNEDIQVVLFLGKPSIRIGGLSQSGGLVSALWRKWMKKIARNHVAKVSVEHILLLGLGGGTVLTEIRRYWPDACVTAVEIDPEVVRLGKKYLGLDVSQVEVVVADAREWLASAADTYDVVIVDLYMGMHGPGWLADRNVLEQLSSLRDGAGKILINRGTFEKHDLVSFERELVDTFDDVHILSSPFNRLFVLS